MAEKIELICSYCGKKFTDYFCKHKNARNVCCSVECKHKKLLNTTEKFWHKVNKNGPVCERLGTRCWEWTGGKDTDGYGEMMFEKKMSKSHRLSWIFAYGPIPKGLCVCHTCDNPKCVNPSHLFLGTNQINTLDRTMKGRSAHNTKGKNGMAKTTEDQAIAIREIYKTGKTTTSIAASFGISRREVNNIVSGKAWKTTEETCS